MFSQFLLFGHESLYILEDPVAKVLFYQDKSTLLANLAAMIDHAVQHHFKYDAAAQKAGPKMHDSVFSLKSKHARLHFIAINWWWPQL